MRKLNFEDFGENFVQFCSVVLCDGQLYHVSVFQIRGFFLQEKNHPWLELSDVHKETTENVRVTVIPFYMGYRENQNNNVYWVSATRIVGTSLENDPVSQVSD